MRDVTYLFGAGASFKAIPFVKKFNKSFKDYMKALKKHLAAGPDFEDRVKVNGSYYEHNYTEVAETLYQICSETYNKVKYHQIFDTYAKMLHLTRNNTELKTLKIVLSSYFYYIQSFKEIDKRYEHFLASIIQGIDVEKPKFDIFPENIRILSWNYDLQFELALRKYLYKITDYHSLINKSNLHIDPISISRNYKFNILKLNGSSLVSEGENTTGLFPTTDTYNDETMAIRRAIEAATVLLFGKNKVEPNLFFSWEGKFYTDKYPDSGLSYQLANTAVLVVIGYSFPLFNRMVDRLIIGQMKKLDTIYLQSPRPGGREAAERLNSIISNMPNGSKINVKLVKEVDQFYLPGEL